jgi:membrane protein implicated in regulation of membrane protease activity
MSDPTLWWIVTGIAVGIELLTGTFYLLMIAIGLGSRCHCGPFRGAMPAQLFTAAVVGGGAVLVWLPGTPQESRRTFSTRRPQCESGHRRDRPHRRMECRWHGVCQVPRCQWAVVHRPGQSPQPGLHRVTELTGNRLVVEPV